MKGTWKSMKGKWKENERKWNENERKWKENEKKSQFLDTIMQVSGGKKNQPFAGFRKKKTGSEKLEVSEETKKKRPRKLNSFFFTNCSSVALACLFLSSTSSSKIAEAST